MEIENQPFEQGGDLDGVDETTQLEDNSFTDTDGDDESTHQSGQEKSTAQLDEERRRAITASIQKAKEAEQARTRADKLEIENKVLKNPVAILDVYETNPQLAEQIAQETWGKSMTEVRQILEQETQNKPTTSSDDFRKVYREEREREEKAQEIKRINQIEIDFFLEKNIDPKNPVFKQTMQLYNKFKPSSYDEARELLDMALTKSLKTGTKAGDVNTVPTIRTAGIAPQKKSKTALSANALALGKKLGLTDEYLK